MALKTFCPPVGPSPGTTIKRRVNILEAEFGDGYSQPSPNGINHIRKELPLAWSGLTEYQMQQIDDFFTEHKGTEPFYYKPVGHREPLKWTCKEWEAKLDGVWSMTATLIQSFTHLT